MIMVSFLVKQFIIQIGKERKEPIHALDPLGMKDSFSIHLLLVPRDTERKTRLRERPI